MQTIRESQQWDAGQYARNGRFVADLGTPVLELLAPQPGERILDIGCGDGALTAKIAAAGAAVVGLDSSAELIAAARQAGIDAHRGDAQQLDYNAEFDAVFSNAALHWMREPDAVAAGVRRALKPGGRFVAEFGGHGNVAAIVTALLAVCRAHGIDGNARLPWYFPSVDEYTELLQRHGFAVQNIVLQPRPTLLPTGMRGWMETFAKAFLEGVEDSAALLDEVCELLAPSLRDGLGRWYGDYVRLRFAAQRVD